MTGIYKITNPKGKVYIGQSWGIENRKSSYSGLFCKGQPRIYRSLKKYGWKNHLFEVVHELPNDITQEILDNYETIYWQVYIDCGIEMLNIKEPGSAGKHSEETKVKMSEWQMGIKKKPESVEKSAAGHRGIKHSEQSKRNMALGQIGRKHSPETIAKMKSIPKTEEWKLQQSELRKGKSFEEIFGKEKAIEMKDKLRNKVITQETREKMSLNRKGKTHEEIFGSEKALKMQEKRKQTFKNKKK